MDGELICRRVELLVSRDTMELWEAMAVRMGREFDELVQVLVMYGAFLLASADLGYLEGITLDRLDPNTMRAVFVPWLRSHTSGERRR